MPTTIAVGVDGSESSLIALRWALKTAAGRGADLLAVIAKPPRHDRAGEPERSTRLRNSEIHDDIVQTRRAITETANGATIHVEELEGNPTQVLLSVSGRVDLLVVGGHGYSGWRDYFTPSVTGQLAVRTKAAVCVVRAIAQPERHRIVVGYETRSGPAAVEFAIAEASVRKASVLIVSTWQYPRDTRATSPEAGVILEQGASAALLQIATDLRQAHPGVAIDTVVRFGYPVDVLAEFAESSDMVVVGSNVYSGLLHSGLKNARLLNSGLATLVVGSVAIGVLRRVATPVVIVPHGG
jgi:nucleotide-binding universal stress UspA family protein